MHKILINFIIFNIILRFQNIKIIDSNLNILGSFWTLFGVQKRKKGPKKGSKKGSAF